MTPASPELVRLARTATNAAERFFRMQVFDAETLADRRAAEHGLRHAIGLRLAVCAVMSSAATSPLDSPRQPAPQSGRAS